MKFPREPEPVEVPGRAFCAFAVALFAWHQGTNGGKIDWISLVLFIAVFLPWLGCIIESVTIKDFSVKFPPTEGRVPQPVQTAASEFWSLSPSAQKILATLHHHRIDYSGHWGFAVDDRNPEYLSFQAGVAELLPRKWIQWASNGLIGLTQQGIQFCEKEDAEISKSKEVYGNFVPVSKRD